MKSFLHYLKRFLQNGQVPTRQVVVSHFIEWAEAIAGRLNVPFDPSMVPNWLQ